MHLMAIVAMGLMWLRSARAAQEALDAGGEDAAFYQAKLVTARFFGERVMPDAGALRRKIEGGAEALMALPAEDFGCTPRIFRAFSCTPPFSAANGTARTLPKP